MKRFHLFEFEDFPWFPATIRNLMTDFLRHSTISMGLYAPVVDLLHEAMARSGTSRVVDLCSGGGGLLVEVQGAITRKYGDTIQVTYTDKYPNIDALSAMCAQSPEDRTFEPSEVDATAVPARLKGVRTMFSALHHFRPDVATKILANAVESRAGIAVFEVSQRSLVGLVPMVLAPLAVWLITPMIRPFSWKRLFFTYVIPAVPFFILWDGVVSALRTYTPGELHRMAQQIPSDGYEWRDGKADAPMAYKVTYLIGTPKEPAKLMARDRAAADVVAFA